MVVGCGDAVYGGSDMTIVQISRIQVLARMERRGLIQCSSGLDGWPLDLDGHTMIFRAAIPPLGFSLLESGSISQR